MEDDEEEEEHQTWVEALSQELADEGPEEDPDYEVGPEYLWGGLENCCSKAATYVQKKRGLTISCHAVYSLSPVLWRRRVKNMPLTTVQKAILRFQERASSLRM